MSILEHHQRAIDRLSDAYRDNEDFLALIIGGSVAKGFARPDSDVDFMIVATDEVFEQRLRDRDLFINRSDLCDYEGGYVDGKIVNETFLRSVAERGNEPSRAAFQGAFACFSRMADLDALLPRIPVYPERGHSERVRAFYSMAFIQRWLLQEAQRHQNLYTIRRAASQLALFSARLILAHNRILFPFHKWLSRTLESAPDKPPAMMKLFTQLLETPNSAAGSALFDAVRGYQEWGVSDLEAYTWFMTDVEWSWMSEATHLEDV
ncbi:MAG: nucleotidyltransferase domain-containing protein [Myxococcota bacterium]